MTFLLIMIGIGVIGILGFLLKTVFEDQFDLAGSLLFGAFCMLMIAGSIATKQQFEKDRLIEAYKAECVQVKAEKEDDD